MRVLDFVIDFGYNNVIYLGDFFRDLSLHRIRILVGTYHIYIVITFSNRVLSIYGYLK